MRDIRFGTAVTLLGAGSLAAFSLAGAAGAAPRTVVTCAHVKAPAPKNGIVTGALSGCTVPAATGGSAKLVANVAGGSAVITWNHKGTTSLTFKEAAETKPDEKEAQGCPKHTSEIVVTGTVTGGTGAAGRAITVGSPFSAEVCVTTNLVTTNEPGNKLKI